MSDDHGVPSTAITSPVQSETDHPGKNDVHNGAIETGSTEDVASSMHVDDSDRTNLLEKCLESLHEQGEDDYHC